MGFLPNVFSDPVLKARQDQLDAQWRSLKALYDTCDQTPDSAFSEFATDFKNWKEFYESGSDWSDDSKSTTDGWQRQAQEWSSRLTGWGCYGTAGSADLGQSDGAIPTVKDPPPDEPGFLDKLGSDLDFWTKTATYTTIGLTVAAIVFAFYLVRKGASGFGVKLGGDK